MSQLNVTTLKHESAGVDNLVLDSSGYTSANGLRISGADKQNTIYQASGDFVMSSDGGNIGILVNPTNAHFNVLTQGTERMRIDSAGRVTMPYQPAFFATIDGGSANTIATNWDVVLTNIGNHFNASTGAFTAPIAGTYLFFANIMTGNQTYHYFHFRKNTSTNVGSYHHTNGSLSGYRHSSGSTVVTLAAYDTISLYVGQGDIYSSGPNPWSGFGGYLIG